MKKKKQQLTKSMEERYKIDALMSASYLESSFYNAFYKNNNPNLN